MDTSSHYDKVVSKTANSRGTLVIDGVKGSLTLKVSFSGILVVIAMALEITHWHQKGEEKTGPRSSNLFIQHTITLKPGKKEGKLN